jgi:predicted secreted protein
VFRIVEGIATPESVLYDDVADRYLVSNINGKPTDIDNNGYITEISPEGKVMKDKFIAGGVNGVKLNAPKGSGILAGVFYVTDINVVRKFDAKTGAPKGEIAFPGAVFLNDISVAKDGRIFVSDSGVNGSLEPAGGDAVYVIDKGKVKPLAKAKELGGPNGLLAVGTDVLVSTMSGSELYRLDEKGARQDVTPIPEGVLDGIVAVGDELLVSSWKGSAVYRGRLGQKFEPLFTGLKGPADIGFDSKRKRLLVPRFMESAVEVYDVK